MAYLRMKYRTPDQPGDMRPVVIRIAILAIGVIMAGLLAMGTLPVGVNVSLVVGLVMCVVALALTGGTSGIILTANALIIGRKIVLLDNVERIEKPAGRNLVNLVRYDGSKVAIYQNRFPTGAQKPWKIEKNTKAKLDKLVLRIERLLKKREAADTP